MSTGASNKQKRKQRKKWKNRLSVGSPPSSILLCVFFSSKVHSKPWKKRPDWYSHWLHLILILVLILIVILHLILILPWKKPDWYSHWLHLFDFSPGEKLDWASAASLFTSRMQTSVSVGPHTFHGKHISFPNLSRTIKKACFIIPDDPTTNLYPYGLQLFFCCSTNYRGNL